MKKSFHDMGYTGKDCIICVLDTAMGDVGKMKTKIEHADNYRIDSDNTSDHATFIASQLNSWAPDATILSYCVFPDGVSKTSLINNALSSIIKLATQNPSKQYFVNMSFAANFGKNVISPSYMTMHKLIKQCNFFRIPVFVASGNDGGEELYIYPSRFQEPICVGASNNSGTKAPFSTLHDQLDFFDEGMNVSGIDRFGMPIWMSGTSMACPNVLGKSVLLACKMRSDNGEWPAEIDLYNELKSCAIDCEIAGYDKRSGYGFVDIKNSDGIYKSSDREELPNTIRDVVARTKSIIKNLIQNSPMLPAASIVRADFTRLLKFGMAGADVKKVKDQLVVLGYLAKSTKITFGADTLAAVKRFQTANGLKSDGIVGILTWNELFGEDQVTSSVSDTDSGVSTAEYTRLIKVGTSGDDVKLVKDKLLELGYLQKSTTTTFGNDTFNAVKSFQKDNGLVADGIVGPQTWGALFSDNIASDTNDQDTDGWTRNLTVGVSGADVKLAKDKLVELGYLRKSTHSTFGNDTKSAVARLQLINGLSATGIIDVETWGVLFSSTVKIPEEVDASEIPDNISRAKAQLIAAELKNVSDARKNMVLDVLKYAVDPDSPPQYPRKFYIRGGNMYDKNLTLNEMTRAKLNAYLSNSSYEQYYNGGRDDMMREASAESNYTTPGDDCSGQDVGLLRKHCSSTTIDGVKKSVSSGFDANANTLFASYCTETTNPKPGDMMHKSGHAGCYVGAGYCVESAGGAYGTALSEVANRRIYSFIDNKTHKMGDWEHFGKWVFLDD